MARGAPGHLRECEPSPRTQQPRHRVEPSFPVCASWRPIFSGARLARADLPDAVDRSDSSLFASKPRRQPALYVMFLIQVGAGKCPLSSLGSCKPPGSIRPIADIFGYGTVRIDRLSLAQDCGGQPLFGRGWLGSGVRVDPTSGPTANVKAGDARRCWSGGIAYADHRIVADARRDCRSVEGNPPGSQRAFR